MSSFAPSTAAADRQASAHAQPQGDLPQRIAIIGRLDTPGGVQSVMLSLIKGLNQHGRVPDLVWDLPPAQKLLDEKDARAGFTPVRFRVPSRLLDRAPIQVRYILRAANVFSDADIGEPYDFYFIFYNGFLVSADAPHLRYLSGPPLLPQLDAVRPGLRGLSYRFLRRVYRHGLRRRFPVYEFHRGSRYVINARYTAQLFEEAHGVQLPVVYPPIDLSGRSFSAADLDKRDTITFFSRFVDYKRPEMVLELARRYPEQRFVFMGGVKPEEQGYYEALRAKAAGQANAHFIANPTQEQVKEVLARTRFYIFPAVNEHFGMATAEAIASGAVPFVHDSGGQREIVPELRLRFSDDRFFEQFAALRELPDYKLNEIRSRLRSHVGQFSEEVFIDRMLSFTQPEFSKGNA